MTEKVSDTSLPVLKNGDFMNFSNSLISFVENVLRISVILSFSMLKNTQIVDTNIPKITLKMYQN